MQTMERVSYKRSSFFLYSVLFSPPSDRMHCSSGIYIRSLLDIVNILGPFFYQTIDDFLIELQDFHVEKLYVLCYKCFIREREKNLP